MNNGIPSWIDEVRDPASVQGMYTNTYVTVSMSTLLFFDYLLVLPTEIHMIWGRQLNLASAFYVLIRYGFLTQNLFTMVHDVHFTQGTGPGLTAQSCRRLIGFLTIFNFLNFAVISAFVAMRISAMYERKWSLGLFIFVLGAISPCSITQFAAWTFTIIPAPWPFPPCISALDDFSPLAALWTRELPIAVSAVSIVYESLCLGLTAAKTFGMYKAQWEAGFSAKLSSFLLRDGSLYFAVLLVLAIINIVSSTIHNPLFYAWQVNADVARTLIPILTTRFILGLKKLVHDTREETQAPTFMTVAFAPITYPASVNRCPDAETISRDIELDENIRGVLAERIP